MPTRCRWVLGAIWLAFLIRGAFYCQYLPLWEGYDEWAHYAFLEHLRLHGTLPLTTDGITEEIRHSVQTAPLPHEAADPMRGYEAQQPPLYYWILSPLNRLLIQVPIATRVRLLRWFSVCIASLAIPFAYLAARELFYSRAMALSVCALIASMPGLMIDIARIGNECLSIAIASWIIVLLLRQRAPALGFALGIGLLTKAYFLAFIPILVVRRRIYSLFVAIAIGGWWYWRNLRLTGSLTGEIMDVAARNLGWSAKLAAVGKVHWLAALDVAAWTHIWTGAWSFFTVRSWIYRVFEVIFAILMIMVILALARRPFGRFKAKLALIGSIEALFAMGIAYQTLMIFIEKKISFSGGWYFYAVVVAESLLLASGALILAGRRRVLLAMGFLTALFAALDLYTVNFVLARHYPAPLGGVLWIMYVLATLGLIKLSAAS